MIHLQRLTVGCELGSGEGWLDAIQFIDEIQDSFCSLLSLGVKEVDLLWVVCEQPENAHHNVSFAFHHALSTQVFQAVVKVFDYLNGPEPVSILANVLYR